MFNWRVLMEQDMAFITASSVGGFFLCALLANKVQVIKLLQNLSKFSRQANTINM